MANGTTDFIEEMNLQQALSSIRALSEGATTFLRALEDVDLAGRNAKAIQRINAEIDSLAANVTIRYFKVAVRLLHESMGDPRDISMDAEIVARSRGVTIRL